MRSVRQYWRPYITCYS